MLMTVIKHQNTQSYSTPIWVKIIHAEFIFVNMTRPSVCVWESDISCRCDTISECYWIQTLTEASLFYLQSISTSTCVRPQSSALHTDARTLFNVPKTGHFQGNERALCFGGEIWTKGGGDWPCTPTSCLIMCCCCLSCSNPLQIFPKEASQVQSTTQVYWEGQADHIHFFILRFKHTVYTYPSILLPFL